MLKKIIACALSCALLCARSTAAADECTGMKQTPIIMQDANGRQLVSLPPEQAACLAKRAAQALIYEDVVKTKDDIIATAKKQVATSSKALSLAEKLAMEERARAEEYKELSVKQAQAIDDLQSWYRSPLFWTGVGAAAVLVVLAVLPKAPGTSGTTIIER